MIKDLLREYEIVDARLEALSRRLVNGQLPTLIEVHDELLVPMRRLMARILIETDLKKDHSNE